MKYHYSCDTFPAFIKTSHDVSAELIGRAAPGVKRGVICASFNAG